MLCSVGNRAWFIFFIVVPVGSTYRLFPVLLLKKVRFTALMYSSFLFCFNDKLKIYFFMKKNLG